MLLDKNGREITAGCKVMWGNTLCDIDWVGESHRKELQEFCAKYIEVVDVDKELECNIKEDTCHTRTKRSKSNGTSGTTRPTQNATGQNRR